MKSEKNKIIKWLVIPLLTILLLVPSLKGDTSNMIGSFSPLYEDTGFNVTIPYPSSGVTGVTRPSANLSARVNGTNLNITISFLNMTGVTNSSQLLGSWTLQSTGRFSISPLANTTLTTQFIWGNTTYYWWLNATNGSSWSNQSYSYTTTGSRYDVDNSSDVVATDVTVDWQHRFGEATFDKLFDVNYSGDVTATDCSIIWSNRT